VERFVPIEQFAAMTRLSAKALRLYAENGLLPPAKIDPASGYRSYRLEQVERARLIRLLRAVGLSLAEIGDFLREPTAARLDEVALALQARQAQRERILRYLRRTLDPEEARTMTERYEVSVKEVAAQPYASKAATVAIGDLERFIGDSVRELSARVAPAGPPFTLYHEPVNDEAEGRVEVGLPTASPPAEGGGVLPAGPVAFTEVAGEEAEYPAILAAYDAVACWPKAHGHELTCPPREIALFDPSNGEAPRFEIAWPIG
jgi:DNA-binding transcriptional MerR regulator